MPLKRTPIAVRSKLQASARIIWLRKILTLFGELSKPFPELSKLSPELELFGQLSKLSPELVPGTRKLSPELELGSTTLRPFSFSSPTGYLQG